MMGCLAVVTANAWTVTYTNPDQWEQPYVYIFGGSGYSTNEGIGKWPGEKMIKVDGSTNWTLEGTGSPTNIIFNNGEGGENNQTNDLEFEAGATYSQPCKANDSWIVYYTNPDNWTKVCAYVYGGSGYDTNTGSIGDWPGGEMTKENNIWSIKGTGNPSNIIFNNGTGGDINQTANLTFTAGKTYSDHSIATSPNTVYLIGSFNEWATDIEKYYLTSTDNENFSGTFTIPTDATFKFLLNGEWYSSVDNFITPNNDQSVTVTLSNGGDNLTLKPWKGGTVSFKVVFSSKTCTLTFLEDSEVKLPDTILLGNNFNGWTGDYSSYLLTNNEGVYTGTFEVPAKGSNEGIAEAPQFQIIFDGTWKGLPEGSNTISLTSGEIKTVTLDGNQNITLNDWTGGKIAFTYTYSTNSLDMLYTTETSIDPTPEASWSVYYTNPDQWENVYIWAWSGEDENTINYTGGTWPGVAMIYDTEKQAYSFTYKGEGSPEYVIFSNGDGIQTENLIFQEGKTYDDSPMSTGPTLPENPEGEWSVYFTNPEGWTNVYVYAWSDTKNEVYGDYWPGVEMTYNADTELWSYSGKGTPESIVFNNNDGVQSDNMNFVNDATYDLNGIVVNVLYLIGGPNEWNPAEGIIMKEVEDNIFAVTGVKMTEEISYFGFTGKLATDDKSEDAWEIVNSYRYGAPLSDMSFDTKGSNSLKAGINSWAIPAGTYDFYVNLNTNTVATTLSATTEQPALNLYLRGSSVNEENTWESAKAALIFDATAKVWTWTGESLGTGFKIGDANWTKEYNIGSNGEALVQGETYEYELDGGNIELPNKTDIIIDPVLTLDLLNGTLLITGYVDEVEINLTLAGTFNEWNTADEKYALTEKATGYTGTFDIPAQASFKVVMNASNWMGMNSLTLTSSSNVKATADKDDNFYLSTWKGGTITFTVNSELTTITLNGTENQSPDQPGVDEPTGDGDETGSVNALEQDAEEVIFNIQGIRVDRNKMTKGLYIINGKKVLVK